MITSSKRICLCQNWLIKLTPTVSIPHNELWLYKNPEALKSVLKGMEEAKAGKAKELMEMFEKNFKEYG